MSRSRPAQAGGAPRPGRRRGEASKVVGAAWTRRFLRNVVLWLVPVWAVWALVTPYYNRFLLANTQSLLRLTERPRVTALYPHPASFHDAYIARLDFPPARQLVRPFRVTDAHFPLVLTAALFLGVPGVARRERMSRLGWALLAGVLFDLVLLFLRVKAVYAAGLGPWSLAHYGPLARNVYGLAWHLFDLPFKLALPFVLWTGFHLRLIVIPDKPERPGLRGGRGR